MTLKTLDGNRENYPAKTVDRKLLLDFLAAAGIDADRTLELHATPNEIVAQYVYGAREVFTIVSNNPGGQLVRAIMARLRGPRLTPGDRVEAALDVRMLNYRPAATYQDAVYEALDQVQKLGLDAADCMPTFASPGPAEVVRYAYAQGWLACETRLAAPNMADAIDLALTTPAAVVEKAAGESDHRWKIRAVQYAVAHGVTAERKTAV